MSAAILFFLLTIEKRGWSETTKEAGRKGESSRLTTNLLRFAFFFLLLFSPYASQLALLDVLIGEPPDKQPHNPLAS